ncbi:MAG: LysM peptidoglycan-binding domain-containing protein [Treponema sp.]|nr:LysM peptidoglycan-binding domain-containing protein [Treponema sp.]
MGENNGTSKTSGLLARIQALQSQEAAKNNEPDNSSIETSDSPLFENEILENDFINPFETESFDFINNPSTENSDFNFDISESVPPVTNDFDLDSSEPVPPVTDDFDFDTSEPVPPVTDDFDLDKEPDFSFGTSSQGLSFTGLYDKETILGDSSDHHEEIRKKTKVPVVICIICAFICLIATTLILFVIPSRYNLIKKTIKVDDNTVMIESTPTLDKTNTNNDEYNKLAEQSNVPPAKENTIIVIVKAEDVIPVPPAKNKKNLKDEIYKIKWGDTLWDISNTYYRSPWKYKKIASFNKISNPDYIISGTTITIPAE